MRIVVILILFYLSSAAVVTGESGEDCINICVFGHFTEYYNYWSGEPIDVYEMTGHWQAVEIVAEIDRSVESEPTYYMVYLAPISDDGVSALLIDYQGIDVAPNELEDILMGDI